MGHHYVSSEFLRRKIRKLVDRTEKTKPEKLTDFVNRLATDIFEGFTFRFTRDSKILENKNGNIIEIPVSYFSRIYRSLEFYIKVYKEECNYFVCDKKDLPHVITVITQNFKSLEADCLKRQNEMDRRNKILELSKNSTLTWLTNMFKNSDYTYSIEKSHLRAMLSVKMKNNMQLKIPVYYKNFQEIMPKLMDLIKEYEKLIESSNIKVIVTNFKKTQKWA
jgi:allophanate hydrolase subunit 1